jgi:ubiquinone/menaquinone biosynthesis C-methylase UbiE
MIRVMVDPIAFRAFEATAWNQLPDPYERFFGPITARAIDPLLDAVDLQPDERLLDVATGPGHIAGRAAARGALAIGLDLARGMIETAARNYPSVRFHVGAAEELPFASGTFDVAVSGFGLGHFAEPGRVVAEFARVVVPEGRVAFSCGTSRRGPVCSACSTKPSRAPKRRRRRTFRLVCLSFNTRRSPRFSHCSRGPACVGDGLEIPVAMFIAHGVVPAAGL